MFNLFGRKPAAPAKPAAAPQGTQSSTNPPSNAFDQMEVMARCIDHVKSHGTFVGGLDAAAGYRVQTMPNGIQVAANRDKKIGVVLDKSIFAMSVAGVRDVELGLIAVSSYFKNYLKQEPKWLFEDPPYVKGPMTAEVPIGTRWIFDLSCDDGAVDTQFDGKNERGCTFTITLRPKS